MVQLSPKRLVGSFLLAIVFFGVLMAPWPGLERTYARFFQAGGNGIFVRFWFWGDGVTRFRDLHNLKPGVLPPGSPELRPTRNRDTLIEMRSRSAPGEIGFLRTSSRLIGYNPIAATIALILATPLPWRRRLRSLLWGLVWVHVFIVVRVSVWLAALGFGAPGKGYALFSPGPFIARMLDHSVTVLHEDPTVSFLVPTLIWFLVAMRLVNRRSSECDGDATNNPQ